MSTNFYLPSAIRKRPKTAIASLIVLGTIGISFVVQAPETGLAPAGAHIEEYKSGSGEIVGYVDDLGNIKISGSYLDVNGSAVGGGVSTIGQGLTLSSGNISLTAAHSGTTIEAFTLLSGATIRDGGNQISALDCATFIIAGSGSDVGTGTYVDHDRPSFSGSIVTIRADHTEVGDGLITYDVNINGVPALSTKLTVDASEASSTTAATPAVLSAVKFNQFADISVDVDGALGNTLPKDGQVKVCVLPDPDGYAPF